MKYIFIIAIVLIAKCANNEAENMNTGEDSVTEEQTENENMDGDFITKELARWNIEVTGEGNSFEELLPKDMDGPNWGLKCLACEDAGYDLKTHGGETVTLTQFYTLETISNGDTLDVWVVHNDTEVFCMYKAVGGHSTVAPGIMSVKK